jgi:hypothetical protein
MSPKPNSKEFLSFVPASSLTVQGLLPMILDTL